MAKINLNKFAGICNNESFEFEGFELEFAPDELPALIKAAMPMMNMLKEMTVEHNSKELERIVNKLNDTNKELRDKEADLRSTSAKLEAKERSVERLIDREKETKSELEEKSAEIAKLKEELFKARMG